MNLSQNFKNKTLLVVDDEEDIRELLTTMFENKGYQVFSACNGKKAFEIILNQTIDLVLTDVRMPGGNGDELLEKIRTRNTSTPIVMLFTGFSGLTIEDCYGKGAAAIFSKPFDRKLLLSTIENALIPREERWKIKEGRVPPSIEIELEGSRLQEAHDAHILNLGQGGFFMAMEENFPKVDEIVSFTFSFLKEEKTIFEGESTTRKIRAVPEKFIIEGTGITRWIRNSAQGDLVAGCGIEIIDLTEQCKTRVIETINLLKTISFIPKS